MRACLIAVLLSGCGADFTGTWVGSLSNKFSCSDGYEERYTVNAQWLVSDTGKQVSISPGGSCGVFDAIATGLYTVRLQQKDCGTTSDVNFRYENDLRSGTLEMDESGGFFGVAVNFGHTVYRKTGAFDSTCDTEMTGRLTKN